MAREKTPAECAKELVSNLVAKFDWRSGRALNLGSAYSLYVTNVMTPAEVQAGLEHAKQIGWIEHPNDGEIVLTDAGFAAA